MVRKGDGKEITSWCKRNKVYDEITDGEIDDNWNRETRDREEAVILNGKVVWETAKRVCDFINAHEDLIHISTFGEYRTVMLKEMKVNREANLDETKRRRTTRKEK